MLSTLVRVALQLPLVVELLAVMAALAILPSRRSILAFFDELAKDMFLAFFAFTFASRGAARGTTARRAAFGVPLAFVFPLPFLPLPVFPTSC